MPIAANTPLDLTRRQLAELSGRLLQAIAGSARYLRSADALLLRRIHPKVMAGAAVLLMTWQYPSRAWPVLGELGDRIVPLWAQLDELSPYLQPLITTPQTDRAFARTLQDLGLPLLVAILESPSMQTWTLALVDKFLPSLPPGYDG